MSALSCTCGRCEACARWNKAAPWSVKKRTPDPERPGRHCFIVSRETGQDTEYVRTKFGSIRRFGTRGEAELAVSALEGATTEGGDAPRAA